MIKDKIENAAFYYSLGDLIKNGLQFLEKTDISNYKNGRYEINGDKSFTLSPVLKTSSRAESPGHLTPSPAFCNGNTAPAIYVSVQDYNTKPEQEGKFEAHKQYIDIQYIVSGQEKLGFTNIENCVPLTYYDEENDIEFLDSKGNHDFVTAKKGDFLIFTPRDAHMPCICIDEPEYVKKAVIKVRIL